MREGYISDDAESRAGSQAPEACRCCRMLLVKKSVITDQVIMRCNQPTGPDSEILSYILLRLAASGHCDLSEEL